MFGNRGGGWNHREAPGSSGAARVSHVLLCRETEIKERRVDQVQGIHRNLLGDQPGERRGRTSGEWTRYMPLGCNGRPPIT